MASYEKTESDKEKMAEKLSDSSKAHQRKPLFVDAEDAKKKIQKTLANNDEKTTLELYKTEGWAQRIARSLVFENLTLVVIGLNSVWIAVDVDHNPAEHIWEADWYFILVENLFCTFFVAEVAVRFAAYARKRDCLTDAWFVFDGSLVFLMVMESWVSPILYAMFKFELQGGGLLAILRLIRLARVARMARLMRAFPELMVLIKGMMVATRSVFFTLLMLMCVIYIFSIVFRQICEGTEMQESFSTVPTAMFTLVVQGLYMDGVYDLMSAFSDHSFLFLMIFVAYLFISSHTILNLLIGVLCEVVTVIAVTEKFELLVLFVRDRMIIIIESHGIDANRISKQDFLTIIQDPEAITTFAEMDVDPVGIVDFTEIIFAGDNVAKDGTMAFPVFMDIMLSFRGTNSATVKDLAQMRKYLVPQFDRINTRLDQLAGTVGAAGTLSSGDDGGGVFPRVHGRGGAAQESDCRGGWPRATANGDSDASNAFLKSDTWQEMRPAFSLVVRESFAESFEASISPQVGRLNACIASISSKLEQSLDRAQAQLLQIGASGPQGSVGSHPHVHVILNTLTELRDKLHQSRTESRSLVGDMTPHGVAELCPEQAQRPPSRFGSGDVAPAEEDLPAPPDATSPLWLEQRRPGPSPPAQEIRVPAPTS